MRRSMSLSPTASSTFYRIKQVCKEIYRLLKTGGWMMVSDIVLLKPLPDAIMISVEAYVSCIARAIMKNGYLDAVTVGFNHQHKGFCC